MEKLYRDAKKYLENFNLSFRCDCCALNYELLKSLQKSVESCTKKGTYEKKTRTKLRKSIHKPRK